MESNVKEDLLISHLLCAYHIRSLGIRAPAQRKGQHLHRPPPPRSHPRSWIYWQWKLKGNCSCCLLT